MSILITGGGGFLGRKLAQAIADAGQVRGRAVEQLVLIDLAQPEPVEAGFNVTCHACDVADPDALSNLTRTQGPFDVIFHLAALASGGSEADFDLGLRINLFGTLAVLEMARGQGNCPVVVYSSSCAVHGGEAPKMVTDRIELNPQTSYGAQKAMAELLLNDMTRRGFVDARGLRLPTVTIRPGRPNTAASSFMSSVFREPLQGGSANCPVSEDFPIWHSAPRIVVANILKAADIDGAAFGFNRCINLPGRTDSIGDMIRAMCRVAGDDVADRITWTPDSDVETIVSGWRAHFAPEKALALGFEVDVSFEDSVRWFLADDRRDDRRDAP